MTFWLFLLDFTLFFSFLLNLFNMFHFPYNCVLLFWQNSQDKYYQFKNRGKTYFNVKNSYNSLLLTHHKRYHSYNLWPWTFSKWYEPNHRNFVFHQMKSDFTECLPRYYRSVCYAIRINSLVPIWPSINIYKALDNLSRVPIWNFICSFIIVILLGPYFCHSLSSNSGCWLIRTRTVWLVKNNANNNTR